MKLKLFAMLLLAGSTVFAGSRVFFGVGVGVSPAYGGYYYAPPPPVVYGPSYYGAPAYYPGQTWINGYWYPNGGNWAWRGGYYARPPFAGAYWVGPRYYSHRYYRGYWGRR